MLVMSRISAAYFVEAEFGGLLERLDEIAAGVGETDHVRAGGLRLDQEGRESAVFSGWRARPAPCRPRP